MTGRKLIRETKGLARAKKSNKTIALTLKDLHDRNNTTVDKAALYVFLSSSLLRLFNIRFEDLQISEFKQVSKPSSKNYCLLILSLYISGKASKSEVVKSFGLHYLTSRKILAQFVDAGYVAVILNKSRHSFNGLGYLKEVPHLQLTSKGYDLAHHICALLVDDRLI